MSWGCQHRAPVGDDHLLVHRKHAIARVHPVQREAECLALPQPGPGAQQDQQDQQGVPIRHRVGERQDLGRRQQPDHGRSPLWQP
jgi:hypothetical protein